VALQFVFTNSVARWNLKAPPGGSQSVAMRIPFSKPAEGSEISRPSLSGSAMRQPACGGRSWPRASKSRFLSRASTKPGAPG